MARATVVISSVVLVSQFLLEELFPGGGDGCTCGVSGAAGWCCPWQSLSFLLVAVVGSVGDRPCWLLSFLLVVSGLVACMAILVFCE